MPTPCLCYTAKTLSVPFSKSLVKASLKIAWKQNTEAISSMGSSPLHSPTPSPGIALSAWKPLASSHHHAFLSQVAGAEEFSTLATANAKLENSFCRLVLC